MFPFRKYEIPGAVASGFLILAACEAAFDGTWLIEREWNPERISIYGSVSLGIGLIFAAASRSLLERRFVRKWLKTPEEILLDVQTSEWNWARVLFPAYYKPLPEETRESILHAGGAGGCDPDEALVDDVGKLMRADRIPPDRFDAAVQLEAVCRTLCLGLLMVSAILASGIVWHSGISAWAQAEWRKLGYGVLSLLESVGMLYRYLKYVRQRVIKEWIAYAGSRSPNDDSHEATVLRPS